MKLPRFTIAGLLGFVLFAAVGLAALRAATDPWDSGVYGITVVLLLSSILLSVHRKAARRAYWLGFALFGWAYLVMSMVPPIESRLPMTQGLAYIDTKVSIREINVANSLARPVGYNTLQLSASSDASLSIQTANPRAIRIWDKSTGNLLLGPNGTTENFLRIGHSLLALVTAYFGANLSRYLYRSGRLERAEEPIIPVPSPSMSEFA